VRLGGCEPPCVMVPICTPAPRYAGRATGLGRHRGLLCAAQYFSSFIWCTPGKGSALWQHFSMLALPTAVASAGTPWRSRSVDEPRCYFLLRSCPATPRSRLPRRCACRCRTVQAQLGSHGKPVQRCFSLSALSSLARTGPVLQAIRQPNTCMQAINHQHTSNSARSGTHAWHHLGTKLVSRHTYQRSFSSGSKQRTY
jgi:hypothetical protein